MDLSTRATLERALSHLENAREEVDDGMDAWRSVGGSQEDLKDLDDMKRMLKTKISYLRNEIKKKSGQPLDGLEVVTNEAGKGTPAAIEAMTTVGTTSGSQGRNVRLWQ